MNRPRDRASAAGHEQLERRAFVRWMKKAHPGVCVRRYGPPARDKYIVPDVQSAWQGWWARSFRYTQSELDRAANRAKRIVRSLRVE